jgi:hypothetical protein
LSATGRSQICVQTRYLIHLKYFKLAISYYIKQSKTILQIHMI